MRGASPGNSALVDRPRALLVVAAVLAASTLYAAVRTPDLMQHYRELFDAFGGTSSPLTRFVLGIPNFWWLLAVPCVALFAWIASRARVTELERRRMKIALVATIALAVGSCGFVAYGLYSHVWQLGNAV